MGFMKDAAVGAAKLGTFGLAGSLFGGKKKTPPKPVPTMISSVSRPTSMIGSSRGDY